jgi:hypothetical protein
MASWGDTPHPPRQGSSAVVSRAAPCTPGPYSLPPNSGGAWVPLVVALHDATAEAGALRRALQTALLRATPAAVVVGVRLELRDLGAPTPLQPGLFDARGAAQLALAAATRGLRTRFGANPLQRVVALDPRHRLPERRYALVEAS